MPGNALGARKANYDKVEADGLPALGAAMESADVVICKRLTASQLGGDRKGKRGNVVDHSTVLTTSETMRVDAAFMTTNKDGARLARVRLRASRVPMIGDKFSSHHGQKGVIGMILPAEDMPFTEDGIVPDLIVNPHGLPSRMTVAQLLEMLLGKLCALEGAVGDGTPFTGESPKRICEALGRCGFESRGNETLFNGVTGEPLQSTVFVRASDRKRAARSERKGEGGRARAERDRHPTLGWSVSLREVAALRRGEDARAEPRADAASLPAARGGSESRWRSAGGRDGTRLHSESWRLVGAPGSALPSERRVLLLRVPSLRPRGRVHGSDGDGARRAGGVLPRLLPRRPRAHRTGLFAVQRGP